MANTITYKIGNSLYINVTNRCTNRCTFCIRYTPSGVGEGIDLWLDSEPAQQEITAEILKQLDKEKFDEIVFCGYGEPLMRFYDVMEVCKEIKQKSDIPIRINTNGHANKIFDKDVTPLMEGLVDTISISLNGKNAQEYEKVCQSDYKEDGFYYMLDFAKKAKDHVKNVILSVVDVISDEDIEECRKIAQGIGVTFRVREYSE